MHLVKKFIGAALFPVSLSLAAPTAHAANVEDYGPFLSYSYVSWPTTKFDNGPGSYTGDSTARGIGIKLSDDWSDGIIFDADLMRISAGWMGMPMHWHGLIWEGDHGWNPTIPNAPVFQTPHLPGWADASGSFADPRPNDMLPLPPAGPLSKDRAHYKGIYRSGATTVVSYTVGKSNILLSPTMDKAGDLKAIDLTYNIDASDVPMVLMVADGNPQIPQPAQPNANANGGRRRGGGAALPANVKIPPQEKFAGAVSGMVATLGAAHYGVIGAPDGAALEINADNQLVLKLPAFSKPIAFKVLISAMATNDAAMKNIVAASAKPADLGQFTKGGAPLWNSPKDILTTTGKVAVAASDIKLQEPYVTDDIGVPFKNPFNARMRLAGFDFFTSDPTKAAVSTWEGDVFIVSGIDDKLDHVTWKRYAAGLFQPLGLKIVDDVIYVVGHDQITRLHDLNNDGEADFYEDFCNDWGLTTAFHAFSFDLQNDAEGNFYFAFGSPVHAGGGGFQKISKDHGCIMKVSKDGSTIEHYACGLRAPNGMCVGPDGQITSGDNQGTWVPTSPLHWISKNEFLGVSDSAHGLTIEQPKPLVWIPMHADNSCGDQVWVTSDKWGPFKGDLLHLSYGTCSLFEVMHENVDGQEQGAVTKFNVRFPSSAMRARFNPKDGQLYVCGLKGWQTSAGAEGGFSRIRYTGGPVRMATDWHATSNGMAVAFTTPLDRKTATDVGNYSVEMWNYKWSGDYGSPEVHVIPAAANGAAANGHDKLKVKSAKLSEDGLTVTLEVENLQPAMTIMTKYNIKAADGTKMQNEIDATIYNMGKSK